MLLPLVNALLIVVMMVVSILKTVLDDPGRTWANVAHWAILTVALIVVIVILVLVSQANTPAGAKAICELVIPCGTATPVP